MVHAILFYMKFGLCGVDRVGFDEGMGDVSWSLDFGIPPMEMSQTSLGGMHLIPLTGVSCGARCRWTA